MNLKLLGNKIDMVLRDLVVSPGIDEWGEEKLLTLDDLEVNGMIPIGAYVTVPSLLPGARVAVELSIYNDKNLITKTKVVKRYSLYGTYYVNEIQYISAISRYIFGVGARARSTDITNPITVSYILILY